MGNGKHGHLELQDCAEDTALQHCGSQYRLGRGLVGATETAVTFSTLNRDDYPVYSRLGNTTNHHELETLLAGLHGAEDALATGSGMGAMTLIFMALAKPGDHVLCQDVCYGGTFHFFEKIMAPWGVECTFAPVIEWKKHVRPNTKFALCESISNPFCQPQDLDAVAAFAKEHKLTSLCDNTFASPVLCRPLNYGINIVFESATKYLNGHSDVVAGAIFSTRDVIQTLRGPHAYLGTFLPTPQCSQLLRGLRTLKLRMLGHCERANALAGFLRQNPGAEEVYYGGSSPRLTSQFPLGFGGMLAVRWNKNIDMPRFVGNLKIISDVPSLGGTETTLTAPAYTTNWFMSNERKIELGITPHLLRISVGLEDPKDLVGDISQALNAATRL